MKITFCIFFLFLINAKTGNAQVSVAQQEALLDLQKSHIEANVPDSNDFESYLNRDLKNYFLNTYGNINITTFFLRNGPSQSGVAYPKFYIWIKISKGEKLLNQGAVRLEAVEKKQFEITDFVSIDEIKSHKKDIYAIFPRLVCETIMSTIK